MVKKTALRCMMCGGRDFQSGDDKPAHCAFCRGIIPAGQYQAHGPEAMSAQTEIIADTNRAVTTRTLAAYGASVVFALISGALIVFAPESRTAAANLVAGAFLVLAVGIAGFTRFKAKAPGLDIEAAGRNSN